MTMRMEGDRGGGSVVAGAILGATLVFGGLFVAYLVFRTSFLAVLTYALRPDGHPARRHGRDRDPAWRSHSRSSPSGRTGWPAWSRRSGPVVAGATGSGCCRPASWRRGPSISATAARRRRSSSGPFGLAVIREVADATAEDVELATRDTDRIRRWLARHEQDFVVRLYTAVAAPEHDLVRTAACALVTPEQLPSWLALLPAQRSLSSSRRDRLARMLEGVERGLVGEPGLEPGTSGI